MIDEPFTRQTCVQRLVDNNIIALYRIINKLTYYFDYKLFEEFKKIHENNNKIWLYFIKLFSVSLIYFFH